MHTDVAKPGDIIGLHNHGTIQIGDTFTDGELLRIQVFLIFHRNCLER